MMNDQEPRLNPYGKPWKPPISDDQRAILLAAFAEGATIDEAALLAKCDRTKARSYHDQRKTAEAIKELQVTTTMVRQLSTLMALVKTQTDAIGDMAARLKANEQQTKRIRAAVAYQKIGLTKARKALRDTKAENKELKRLLHRHTGLFPPK